MFHKTLIEKSEAEIDTDFSAIDTIIFNPVYLEIFMNLLVNALRYSDPVRKPVIHICSSIEKGSQFCVSAIMVLDEHGPCTG